MALEIVGRIEGARSPCPLGGRVIVTNPDDGIVLVGGPKSKPITGATLDAVHVGSGRFTVSMEGASQGGVYKWAIDLWDVASWSKVKRLVACEPADKTGQLEAIADGFVGIHSLGLAASPKREEKIVRFDVNGKKVGAEHVVPGLAVVHLIAPTKDGRRVAGVDFKAAGGIVDSQTGAFTKLTGGSFKIGRDHDRAIARLAFDATGELLVAAGDVPLRVSVWGARGKTVKGPWDGRTFNGVQIVGSTLCLVEPERITLQPLAGGDARTIDVGKGRLVDAGDARHVVFVDAGPQPRGEDVRKSAPIIVIDVTSGKSFKLKAPAAMGPRFTSVGALAGVVAVTDSAGQIAVANLAG